MTWALLVPTSVRRRSFVRNHIRFRCSVGRTTKAINRTVWRAITYFKFRVAGKKAVAHATQQRPGSRFQQRRRCSIQTSNRTVVVKCWVIRFPCATARPEATARKRMAHTSQYAIFTSTFQKSSKICEKENERRIGSNDMLFKPFDFSFDLLGDAMFDDVNLIEVYAEPFGNSIGRELLVHQQVEDLKFLRI